MNLRSYSFAGANAEHTPIIGGLGSQASLQEGHVPQTKVIGLHFSPSPDDIHPPFVKYIDNAVEN